MTATDPPFPVDASDLAGTVPGQARPAATLVLLCDQPKGPPHILMVVRGATMEFAAGALVFPGGAVDTADRALAARVASSFAIEVDDAASRIAAIRETIEEIGIVCGLDREATPDETATLRQALLGGADMESSLAQVGLSLDLAALVPFARWFPPKWITKRIYDTRFYVARATSDLHAAAPDGSETVRVFLKSADDYLAMQARGEVSLIFPTHRNVERLAQAGSFDALLDHVRAFPPRLIQPYREERDGAAYLCIPEGLGYPVTRMRIEP